MSNVAARPARVLSGGEQQRLALARAWALGPEVLFLDEPTKPASRCAWSRWAPGRRWIWRGAVTPTWCSCMHDKDAEEKFLADGFGVKRFDVMVNDFVVVGPQSDAAKIAGGKDILAAYKKIADAKTPFASRGDKSGTHAAELRLWKAAGVDPQSGKGTWYRETGSGMGPTLNTASAMNAYAFTDRGTWLSFRNRGELVIVIEGDQRLFNQYGVMLVNPAKHPHVKREMGQTFVDWVTSPEGQQTIAGYKIGSDQLFFPNAKK